MLALLGLALQLQLSAAPAPPQARGATDEDSLRDVARAHDAQAGFERGRRYVLPWSLGSGGRCDVRVGRFCWWYESGDATPPAEPPEVSRRRGELLRELDDLGARHPGDPWIAGMRVYYRVEDLHAADADSIAAECRAGGWWCSALHGYAAQARGDIGAADSAFATAFAAMPDSTRCAWRDITVLLPGDARGRYEHLSCADRAPLEARYWMLSTPRLSARANEWRTEFYARRVAATLLASAVSPHRIGWGPDTEELLLRYGWPVAWSRVTPPSVLVIEPEILGHDPSPSFHYAPRAELLDSAAAARDDGWDLNDIHAESRYAHRSIRHLAGVAAQLARFRRGDSTLLVAAWAASDDSLTSPAAVLGAMTDDGHLVAHPADSTRTGRAQLMLAGRTRLAGVEVVDTTTGTLARSRVLYAPRADTGSVALSDILVYRPADEQVPALDAALALAIPGDSASVTRPLGLYWEAYGTDSAGAEMETSIVVERTDHGIFRSVRQRLGLADPDSPLRVRWNEARPTGNGVTARALALDLSTLPAGHYRITLAVTPAGGRGASTEREIELRDH